MSYRWVPAVVVLIAAFATGCSPGKPTVSTQPHHASISNPVSSWPEPTSSQGIAPAGATLDSQACAEVTQANLDLATASTTEDARKAANVIEKYEPPAQVTAAVEHFVETGGAQFDDPDYDKNNKVIDDWVKQVCPI